MIGEEGAEGKTGGEKREKIFHMSFDISQWPFQSGSISDRCPEVEPNQQKMK
jgi:hypothetical protein